MNVCEAIYHFQGLFFFANVETRLTKVKFDRAREEELIYVLRKLLSLRLWPGSLWASLSDNPTEHCISQPCNSPFPALFSV